MTFREILKDKKMDDHSVEHFIDAMDDYLEDHEDFKMAVSLIVNDGHLCEYSAKHKILELHPVVLLDGEGTPLSVKDMCEYLTLRGITPDISHKAVSSAYDELRIMAREKGASLAELKANKWDAFYAMAKVFACHWFSVKGDMSKAAALACEHLLS